MRSIRSSDFIEDIDSDVNMTYRYPNRVLDSTRFLGVRICLK
jgi:hypothetical protein